MRRACMLTPVAAAVLVLTEHQRTPERVLIMERCRWKAAVQCPTCVCQLSLQLHDNCCVGHDRCELTQEHADLQTARGVSDDCWRTAAKWSQFLCLLGAVWHSSDVSAIYKAALLSYLDGSSTS